MDCDTLLKRFEDATRLQMDKIRHLIGNTYGGMVLHSCNDLGILYFTKPGGKKLHTQSDYRTIEELL